MFPASVPSEVFLHIDFKLFSRDFLPFRSPSMKLTLTSPYLILLPLICVHGFIMEGNENALLSDVRQLRAVKGKRPNDGLTVLTMI